MSNNEPQKTPDYGEPWMPSFRNSARDRDGKDHGFMDCHQRRAIQCVNACAGLEDPEKAVEHIKTLAAIANDLAAWSDRWPRSKMYSANNRQMDDELIELENRAKSAVAIFNA